MNNLQNNQKSDAPPMGYDALLAPVPLYRSAKRSNLILLGALKCDSRLVISRALLWARQWMNYARAVKRDAEKSMYPLSIETQNEAKLIGEYFEKLLVSRNWC